MTLSLKPTVLRLRRWNMRFVFFFNDTATTEIYTLSLHDALPISGSSDCARGPCTRRCRDPSEPFVPDRIKRSNERLEPSDLAPEDRKASDVFPRDRSAHNREILRQLQCPLSCG